MNKKKGFTLVELLISISIIVLITAFTMPSFSQFAQRKRFERIANRFASDVANLRSRAMAGARPINQSRAVNDGDLWGMIFYCTASTSGDPLYVGGYYPIYRGVGGSYYDFGDYNNLNYGENTRSGFQFRFQCPGNPAIGWNYIYFDKFTGLGSTSTSDSGFFSSDSITATIVMQTTGWTKNVVIYKSGIVDIQ